ncbi:MAG TPA: endonuclease/exonuclease/phosphatase family protein [Candidatus Polarisedimenticolia bacterium]|nr:endonuclease/exonuclease/phosphatase family protein [Candidatus Polarisedimenticolia bacterium]
MLSNSLRLVSANLGNGTAESDAFADLMDHLQPDAAAVQEITPLQARALAGVLPYGDLAPSWHFAGMGIALRQPGRVRPLSLGYRNAWIAEVASGEGRSIEVINVHIRAPHLRPFSRTIHLRRQQLRAIEAYLATASDDPRAVVGDLNSTPRWPLYRRLARKLTDAAVVGARRSGGRPERTWTPSPGIPRLFRIDHIFVGGLEVDDFRVVPIKGSDHCVVVADVRIGSRAELRPQGRQRQPESTLLPDPAGMTE